MRTAFIETLCDLAAQDERIFLLTGDLGYSVLEPFARCYPKRYLNAGIAEQNMTGVAAGLALCGKTVFTYSIANFPLLRCLEQVRNDVCYHRANVKIVAVGGGCTYGSSGYTHHGVEDLAVARSLPGMTVIAPADPIETRLAMRALARMSGPCYLRLGKAGEPVVHRGEPEFEIGRAVQVRTGRDVTLISTGAMLKETLSAADQLARQGIEAGVLSMHTLKPLDRQALRQAAEQTGAIVTVEEHSVIGGLGSAVADFLAEADLSYVRLRKHALPDELQRKVGSQQYFRRLSGSIVASVKLLVAEPAGAPV
ncbi:MAG TPA: transketolase C-terminal domain-containing protein [Phycisphaerae bacterium]|nr:transketolase C-terminal domain-containing protein [Phycisphaerae bacterium]